ncbi:TraR/DksA C4-type zinc finger protein [Kribbella sp. NBC_01510]
MKTNENRTPATAPAKSAAHKAETLTVKSGETPWTAAELAELRGELEADVVHLRKEIHDAEQEIVGLLRDGGDGAGNDQADVGSTTLERDHEMSLANNARDMLDQIERALAKIDDGTYGVCESCGNAIGKGRLQAFPRATLCVSCKEREERR